MMSAADKPTVGLSQSLWWMVFLFDTVTLSMTLQYFKAFTLSPTFSNGFWLFLITSGLILFTGALIYDGYAKERANGKVKNTFWLFESIYEKQSPPTITKDEAQS